MLLGGSVILSIKRALSLLQDENRLRKVLSFANTCGAVIVTERRAISALPTSKVVMDDFLNIVVWACLHYMATYFTSVHIHFGLIKIRNIYHFIFYKYCIATYYLISYLSRFNFLNFYLINEDRRDVMTHEVKGSSET